ncbi:Hint domain-containing protein [Rhizobium sp. ARZ01]|uniref:Hint domain-containing protein n=1 Tax=Rhizobium sp. ARZ01 TaxID=2769313 RepID=UPI0017853062|nr:Hint domain-containing protein [Rhizobium sp. ARZ01]MBD9371774.1 Hint domain-containing protein [Rhizobium sp. ARZ01]
MTPDNERSSQVNRARRHFLGAAAAAGAKVAAMGVFATTIFPASKARAKGTNWGDGGDGGRGSRCFLRGTAILTTNGEVRVEELTVGDLVETVNGKSMKVRWIGRQVFKRAGPAWPKNVMPIRISRHALDQQTPHTDLYVSPDHAFFIDGVLIRAKDLVNGATIAPCLPSACETVEYFNLLLDSHEVILAEGAPAETFRPVAGNHEAFANFAELEHLLPDVARNTMAPFAPVVGFRGRDHLKALLLLGLRPFTPSDDPIADAQARFAARAKELAD